MKDLLLRDVRLIDPIAKVDRQSCDVVISNGLVVEIGEGLSPPPGGVVMDRPGTVVAPAFLDLHCHLREPGQAWKERIVSATAAAAAGGFGAVCAMANLQPPLDTPQRLRRCESKTRALARVPVFQFAAATADLAGQKVVDVESMVRAGAVGFSDDGRNCCDQATLTQLIAKAGSAGRVVAIHPEDERVLAAANPDSEDDPSAWFMRPAEAEVAAVETAIGALRAATLGSLHLQHLSTARSAELLRQAKRDGLRVTAEVTPHHLMLSAADTAGTGLTCNPPLRGEEDRIALWEALLDGTIDAIASDHAPHEAPSDPRQRRSPGFSGIQSVLSVVLGQGSAQAHLPRLLEALTAGPLAVLGQAAEGLPTREIAVGQPAHLTWFDPARSWSPDTTSWLSLGANTPYWGQRLRGVVLGTFVRGRSAYLSRSVAPEIGIV